jgi:predicted phage tail protein
LALAMSLRLYKTSSKLVCLVQDKSYINSYNGKKIMGISQKVINDLLLLFDEVIGVDLLGVNNYVIPTDHFTNSSTYENIFYYCTKLVVVGLTQFDKIIYLDASTIIQKNIDYILICNEKEINNTNELIEKRKIETIYIVPAIVGSGFEIAIGFGLAGSFGGLSLAGLAVAGLVNGIISLGVSLAVSFLTSSLNKQATPPQQNIAVGGSTAMISAAGKSYIFSNKENVASQGSSIPVGYGLMKVSSNIISTSIRSYSTNEYYFDEFNKGSSQYIDIIN